MNNNIFKSSFNIVDGIICFDIKNVTTKKIQDFYKYDPFPNYRENDNKHTILSIGEKNIVAKQIKENFKFNKKILEVGSGTCQLSNYLAIGTNNDIYAMDPTIQSLSLGYKFCKENNISNVNFVNADLFEDVFNEETFDLVWCSGVLHHTKNPYQGFQTILKSLKKNGYIVVGLYNRFFRVKTIIRKYLFKIFGKNIVLFLDPYLRKIKDDKKKVRAWISDQYEHPVESLHTFDEVLFWFKKNDVDFVSSIPTCESGLKNNIFKEHKVGDRFSRLFSQILSIFSPLGNEGGLFIFIGKKK